jgi:acetylornithine deacetylase/succinyl-diaminopimelate desuccinylase-like protein
LAAQTKTSNIAIGRNTPEARRIAALAAQPSIGEAFSWFSRERAWITEQQLQLCRIAAPTFFEQRRAEWLRGALTNLGWHTRLDRAGNVLAQFSSRPPGIAVSAHLDTVFAPSRPEDIAVSGDGRLTGPGVADNGVGLAALIALARCLADVVQLQALAESILLAANVGEEGEGNLSGMRYLCRHAATIRNGQTDAATSNINTFVVLDGPSTDHVTAEALASRRFEIGITGPGGHSWNDRGVPNPAHAISFMVASFLDAAERRYHGEKRKHSYNFGILESGSSVNSIPTEARAKLDLRSEDPGMLDDLAKLLGPALEAALERGNRHSGPARLSGKIRELGSRPGGKLDDSSALLSTILAVDAYLGIRSRVDCASTDANIPLSLGLAAISVGAGGQGGGAHTPNEWYQPDGREIGLRRILLLLAGMANAKAGESHPISQTESPQSGE